MARERTDTWLFFGDSITLGVNASESPGGFVARLALLGAERGWYELPPATFYNLGARRQRLAQIRARLRAEHEARRMPGMVSRLALCAGTVDIMGGASPEEAARELAALLHEAGSVAPSLFLCPPPCADRAARERIGDFGARAEELCSRTGIPCVNLFPKLEALNFPELLTDSVHPGPRGNALIASLLAEEEKIEHFLRPEA